LLITIFPLVAVGQTNTQVDKEIDIHQLWIDCKLSDVVSFDVFNTAMTGYRSIDSLKKKNILTIIDFSKPSSEKRFLVVDLEKKQLLYRCLVAHGKNSGENLASSFSNQTQSLKSSLGLYLTAETYTGRHGYSLKLDGLENVINGNARAREIVIHGAEYVSEEYIKKNGRMGRSWGCPALPVEVSKEVIDKISGGSCLFIYADDKYYKEHSAFVKKK
jgi:hypothetical protein